MLNLDVMLTKQKPYGLGQKRVYGKNLLETNLVWNHSRRFKLLGIWSELAKMDYIPIDWVLG